MTTGCSAAWMRYQAYIQREEKEHQQRGIIAYLPFFIILMDRNALDVTGHSSLIQVEASVGKTDEEIYLCNSDYNCVAF
ncbi:hypothetical protein FHG87_004068 [Trinorchestia longiramus]|nr:hypothetical protein FHG87_004068 [Trinorchestia longiramus]